MKKIKFITLSLLLVIGGFYNTSNAASYLDYLEVPAELENEFLRNIANKLVNKENIIIKEIVEYVYNAPIRTNQYLSKITDQVNKVIRNINDISKENIQEVSESIVSHILNNLGYKFDKDPETKRLETISNDFRNKILRNILNIIDCEMDSNTILNNIVYHIYNSPIRSDNNLSTITSQVNQVIRLYNKENGDNKITEVSEDIVSDILNKSGWKFYNDSDTNSTDSDSL